MYFWEKLSVTFVYLLHDIMLLTISQKLLEWIMREKVAWIDANWGPNSPFAPKEDILKKLTMFLFPPFWASTCYNISKKIPRTHHWLILGQIQPKNPICPRKNNFCENWPLILYNNFAQHATPSSKKSLKPIMI